MTFPIKKRINTELFIDKETRALCTQGRKRKDQGNILIKYMDQENNGPH